jgi:RNA polymerase sigma factor (sigma-70 family)
VNRADAEDAFQATFLVLLRKASALRFPEALGSWLFGVAHRTALEARRATARRRAKEANAMLTEPSRENDNGDLRVILDREVAALPERYRAVVVLCDMEGKSRKEAAKALRCAEGTVASRLSRARARLAKRLSRRGMSLSAGALVTILSENASAAVPHTVRTKMIHTATAVAAGHAAAGVVSAPVAALVKGALQSMWLSKLKIAGAVVLAVALSCGVVVALMPRSAATAEADGNRPTRTTKASLSSGGGQDDTPAKTIQQTLNDAAKAADDIPEPYERAQVLAHIGWVQSRAGAKEMSQETFKKAVLAARLLPAQDAKQATERCELLFHVADMIGASHDWTGARALADNIVGNEAQFGGNLEVRRAHFLGQLAYWQLQAGQEQEASKTMDEASRDNRDYFEACRAKLRAEANDWTQALQIAAKIEDAGQRAVTLAEVSVLQYKAGRKDEARQGLQQARKLLQGDNSGDGRNRLAVAVAHVKTGEAAEGLRLAESIENKTNHYPDRENALAEVYLEMGDVPNSLKWARKAREISPQSEYPFCQLVESHAKSRHFNAAFEIVAEMKEPHFRTNALRFIGKEQHRAGLHDESAETFRLAVEVAEKAPVPERNFGFFNHASIFGQIAADQAEMGEAATARVWINRHIAANNRAYALAGLAEGLHKRMQATAKK